MCCPSLPYSILLTQHSFCFQSRFSLQSYISHINKSNNRKNNNNNNCLWIITVVRFDVHFHLLICCPSHTLQHDTPSLQKPTHHTSIHITANVFTAPSVLMKSLLLYPTTTISLLLPLSRLPTLPPPQPLLTALPIKHCVTTTITIRHPTAYLHNDSYQTISKTAVRVLLLNYDNTNYLLLFKTL